MNDMTATLRGLTIGCGTIYPIAGAGPDGLLSTATVRVSDQNIPRRSGVIAGDDMLGGRLVSFEVIMQEGPAGNEVAAAALTAAFAPAKTDEFLDVRVTGIPAEYSLLGRPRGCTIQMSRERWDADVLDARCSFMATDPVRYGPEQNVSIALAEPGTGLVFPLTFPFVFAGGGSGSGTGLAVNSGTTSVYWSATLTGPLTNPRLALVGSGQFVQVAATIAAGQTVVLDASAGAILLNGSSPRPSWFGAGSSWWQLAPGNNSILLTADAGSGGATVTWRPGWS